MKGILVFAGLAALAAASPSLAQDPMPTDGEMLAEWKEMMGEAKPKPQIPSSLREIIPNSGPLRFNVIALDGEAIPVNISHVDPTEFELFQGKRFLGFKEGGYEYYGYTVLDRQMSGEAASIQTGAKPSFSPNGRWIVAAEMSEAGYNGLEAIGLWEILPDRTVERLIASYGLHGYHWRVEGWPNDMCAVISYIDENWQAPEGTDYETSIKIAPRQYLAVYPGESIRIRQSWEEDKCND